jgi:AbiV family abortive infection protein
MQITISEQLWKQLMQESLKGVIRLLDASHNLLLNSGNKEICAGLYTYAIEEYGKYLLLKQNTPTNGKVAIDYVEIFREKRHKIKFETAINDLKKQAPECINLAKGLFDPEIFDPNIFDTRPPVEVNFQARMGIFYCDLSNSKNEIMQVPLVDENLLKTAIVKLRNIANNLVML